MGRLSLSCLLLGMLGTWKVGGVAGQPSPTEVPTPANIVCYQEIVGSLTGSYDQVSASIQTWASSLVSSLELAGDLHTYVDWAQVPDRNSFENGCDGPYDTVADVFVHIPTTTADYDEVSAALEAFVAANPWPSRPSISCSARSVVTFLPGCGKVPSGPNPPQPVNLCFQEIVGSHASYDAVSASLQAWATGLTTALDLQGDLHTYVDWARVPDRTSFENGCDGPYPTVADIYVHIPTNVNDFAALSVLLEAYVASHPFTPAADPNFACGARSNTDVIPGCSPTPTSAPTLTPTVPSGGNPTNPPAATSAPTDAPTAAPTSAPAPTTPPGPTPANIVCYQAVVASSEGTYEQVSAAILAWSQALITALGSHIDPTADVHTFVDWAQITDRDSFEGCPGPYTSLADVYVHIPTTTANYPQVSAALEAFVAANPLTSRAPITCSARSDVSQLPGCGRIPPGPNPTLPPDSVNVCFQEIVGSNQDYPTVSAALQTWAQGLVAALGLTGDLHTYADWAEVPDRSSFENGCNGPYETVADIYVHIPANTNTFAGIQAQLEAYIATHPFTGGSSPILCSARSNTDVIPGCAPTPTPAPANPTVPSGGNPTNPPAATSAPTQGPTPANVVCYQAIVGSHGTYAAVESSFAAWSAALLLALSLQGDVHTYVDWAQVPDRTSFEGCAGPYPVVADIWVHIPTTSADYQAKSLALEAFLLANPISAQPAIACSARSDTTNLPTCGRVPSGPAPPGGQGIACYQAIVGSLHGTYAQVEAQLAAWAAQAQTALGLQGDVHTFADWAQVPDRNSFENGCNGPYQTVADIFVHIPVDSPNYNTIVANLASYAQTHPFAGQGVIDCAAVSVVNNIPICGQFSVSSPAPNQAAGNQQQTTLNTSGAGPTNHATTATYLITIITAVVAWFY